MLYLSSHPQPTYYNRNTVLAILAKGRIEFLQNYPRMQDFKGKREVRSFVQGIAHGERFSVRTLVRTHTCVKEVSISFGPIVLLLWFTVLLTID